MSARSVCSGTRPSRYHSRRPISAPPSRPEHWMRIPFAPNFIVEIIDFFIARRNATRRSSCSAMFSATSWASSSAFRISLMLMKMSRLVNCASSLRSVSTSAPRLPIRMPGRAVWMFTTTFSPVRSITTFEMPAW